MLAARTSHLPRTENTFRLGARGEGEIWKCRYLASVREIGHVVRGSGNVPGLPLDGTRAFGSLAALKAQLGNRGDEQQPRFTESSDPARRWIYSIFDCLVLHLFNFI